MIIAAGTAVPKHKIPQSTVVEFMANAHGMDEKASQRLRALYRATAIESRFTVIKDYAEPSPASWGFYPKNLELKPFPSTKDRAELYQREAIKLSEAAAEECLQKTHLDKSDITHLITVSCTGMYAPGLDIDLVKELGLNTSVERTSINFMGCYAAMIAMKSALAFCHQQADAKVLVVATELCTIHFQKESDEDNLVANAIFGDGSAAIILSNNKSDSKNEVCLSPRAFHTELIPEGADEMAWHIGNSGFEMKLSTYVPSLIEKGIEDLVSRLQTKAGINQSDHFAIHPGGKRILEVIEEQLGIEKSDNWPGREVLKNYGNMSSPTVLFTLKRLWGNLANENAGEHVLSLAFGPGLTVESLILEVV